MDDTAGESLGDGARRVWLYRPAGETRAVVLFLHGSGEVGPEPNEPWLRHLASTGAAVVYPQFQEHAETPGETLLDDLEAGVAAAWERLGRPDRPVAAIGFSAGGFLAVHVTARAAERGLPRPRAILAVFPGEGYGPQRADLRRFPADVDLTLLVGDRDALVGRAGADLIVSELPGHPVEHIRIVEIVSTGDFVADHAAPMRDEPGSREAFWRRGDALVDHVAGPAPPAETGRSLPLSPG